MTKLPATRSGHRRNLCLSDLIQRARDLEKGNPYQNYLTLLLFRDAATYVLEIDYTQRVEVAKWMTSVWQHQCPDEKQSPLVWDIGGYFADIEIPDLLAMPYLEPGVESVRECWQVIQLKVDEALASMTET